MTFGHPRIRLPANSPRPASLPESPQLQEGGIAPSLEIGGSGYGLASRSGRSGPGKRRGMGRLAVRGHELVSHFLLCAADPSSPESPGRRPGGVDHDLELLDVRAFDRAPLRLASDRRPRVMSDFLGQPGLHCPSCTRCYTNAAVFAA